MITKPRKEYPPTPVTLCIRSLRATLMFQYKCRRYPNLKTALLPVLCCGKALILSRVWLCSLTAGLSTEKMSEFFLGSPKVRQALYHGLITPPELPYQITLPDMIPAIHRLQCQNICVCKEAVIQSHFLFQTTVQAGLIIRVSRRQSP